MHQMNDTMLQELAKLSIPTNKNEEPSIIWSNSMISLRAEQYLHFIELSKNTRSFYKELCTNTRSLPVSKVRITTDLLTINYLKDLNSVQLSDVLIDPSCWSFNNDLVDQMAAHVTFSWSPDEVFKKKPVISVLNNLGNVEFYTNEHASWKCLLNLTQQIKEQRNYNLNKIKYEEWREVINSIVATAICWAPQLNKTSSFVTGMKNGSIMFWFITQDNEELNAKLIREFNPDFGELYKIEWISTSACTFILICTNILGQVFQLQCRISISNVFVKKSCLWNAQDNMIVKHLAYANVDGRIVIGYNKYRHFIIQALDASGPTQAVNNLNDYKITDVKVKDNCFYVSTINMCIFKVNFDIKDTDLSLDITQVHVKENYANYELYGIDLLDNGVVWALSVRDRQPNTDRILNNFSIILMTNENTSEVEKLLNNPSKKLTHHWDCIELLRYKIMKEKKMPAIDYKHLHAEAEVDEYKLKLYFVLLTFYNTLEKMCCNVNRNILPITCIEKIKDQIFLQQAKKQIALLNEKVKIESLSTLETEYCTGCNTFIRYFCKKYDEKFAEIVQEECSFLNLQPADYRCMSCDAILDGFSCKNNHINMFCMLTFTLIESDDYLVCTACNHTARIELFDYKPMCLFCDLYLNNSNLFA